MEWKPSRAIPFLLPEMPMRACPHKRLDKNNLRKRREKKGGTKMNETRVFADGYRGVFQKQEDFLECLKSIGRNSFWERRNSKNLRLVAITSGSKVEEELKEILDRAGISGAGLRRVEKSVYARILNDCLKVAKGEALLRISVTPRVTWPL